jgi:hypothetical protein
MPHARLIDVEKMRLHEMEGGENVTYVSLSYCWGGGSQLVKTIPTNTVLIGSLDNIF